MRCSAMQCNANAAHMCHDAILLMRREEQESMVASGGVICLKFLLGSHTTVEHVGTCGTFCPPIWGLLALLSPLSH